MSALVKDVITVCWGLFFVVWVVAALFTKRTAYRDNAGRRLLYILPAVAGWFFLFRGKRLSRPFNFQIVPETDAMLVLAAFFCLGGVLLCIWARAVLGRNWSGTVTLKENHELIVRGPYRLVRHPIYTGLLMMLAGTALQQGRLASLFAVVVVFVALWIKLRQEEELMVKQFPAEYPSYCARVKRIIPFVL